MDRAAGVVRDAVDSVTGVGKEAASRPATTSGRDDESPPLALQHRAERGAGEAIAPRNRTASGSPVAVTAGEVASLQRWLARVWPAVALGVGGASGAGIVEVIAGDLFRPTLAVVTGLLLASSPVFPASGDAPLTGQHGVAGASRAAPAPAHLPAAGDGGGIVYLIAITGLLALLAFTVWREFRMALPHGLR